VKGHLDAVTERAATPVIVKYTGVLAAADIEEFTKTTTFQSGRWCRRCEGELTAGERRRIPIDRGEIQ
jgi:hypothetical protein